MNLCPSFKSNSSFIILSKRQIRKYFLKYVFFKSIVLIIESHYRFPLSCAVTSCQTAGIKVICVCGYGERGEYM